MVHLCRAEVPEGGLEVEAPAAAVLDRGAVGALAALEPVVRERAERREVLKRSATAASAERHQVAA
jgi:hypothetical protein